MILLVFPGGGSPTTPQYASVYRLLEQAGAAYGYARVDTSVRWPGHDLKGLLTLNGALDVASQKLDEIEADGENYDLLARSFGCFVALRLALNRQSTLLRKIVLWGPPPYWLMWEMFVQDLNKKWKQKSKEKELAVDDTLFPSLEPVESLLPKITYETVVTTGDQDPYVPKSYLDYLGAIVRERANTKLHQNIRFKDAVPGAEHEVAEDAPEPVKDAYVRALFE